jgi:hypothetical protein
LFQQAHPKGEVRETALVHVPIYVFKYAHKSQTYTAVVDAATEPIGQYLPTKDEMPFGWWVGGAAVYLCIASVLWLALSGSAD